ncbi:hypothetical protein GGI04_002728 [Coemansia thaxteri]|uniref:Nascent polypeptide-associated complex subunit alpha n=1 Tax=Coemansia thaxteri TaxID=2663907 RepID=A0A9W8EH91_9FUNG|nr:hypothetical protein H4R26_003870 [Coemansia thaxteri]KAJ2004085.1 hypothetical protein GGI04_002728 [Coemansia thaxteri]KAJ2470822.1 hypothetical protein GGI02_002674 [Coemansia sp. RSA 2322]KAJ2486009.1 hypothetical protein EV174_001384 [Coemansia sp. RSA 2320]
MTAENKVVEIVEEEAGSAQSVATPAGGEKQQSAAERKARKAMQKKGLEQVVGISNVNIMRRRAAMFSIYSPDVYKNATSDTWIVFGEARVDNLGKMMNAGGKRGARAPAAAVEESSSSSSAAAGGSVVATAEGAVAVTEEQVDESGVEGKDVELVMSQANCTRAQAVESLKKNANDVVNSIMELTLV